MYLNPRAVPLCELQRLEALGKYEVLDTPAEEIFDRITQLAQNIFEVPVAMINMVDRDRVWFKSNLGFEGATEAARDISLCSLTVLNNGITVIEDAHAVQELAANPIVYPEVSGGKSEAGVRFYAGAPLTTSDGYRIGSLCIVDILPQFLTSRDCQMLEGLADIAMSELETRLSSRKQVQMEKQARDQAQRTIEGLTGAKNRQVKVCAWSKRIKDGDRWVSFERYLQSHFNIQVSHGMAEDQLDRFS